MRYALENTHKARLSPSGGRTSMAPSLRRGPKGDTGDITPEAIAARDAAAASALAADGSADAAASSATDAATSATQAETFAAGTVALQDEAVSTLIDTPAAGPLTSAALNASIAAKVADLAPVKDATPTLDELRQTVRLGDSDITTTTTRLLFVADATMVALDQLSLACTAAVPGSTTDYWTISVAAHRSGTALTVMSKTTKPTANGGEPIAAFKGWNFDTIAPSEFNGLTDGDSFVLTMTPTGSPPPLAGLLASFRTIPVAEVAPVESVHITDSFDRADSASTLGTTDTGETWLNYNFLTEGAWGISSNQAYVAAISSGGGQNLAVVDAGVSDCTIQFKFALSSASGGATFRMSDAYNGFVSNQSALFRFTGGVMTQVGVFSTVFLSSDTMRVVLDGRQITVYRQVASAGGFVQVLQVEDEFNVTATKHGLRSASTANRFDDFSVVWP